MLSFNFIILVSLGYAACTTFPTTPAELFENISFSIEQNNLDEVRYSVKSEDLTQNDYYPLVDSSIPQFDEECMYYVVPLSTSMDKDEDYMKGLVQEIQDTPTPPSVVDIFTKNSDPRRLKKHQEIRNKYKHPRMDMPTRTTPNEEINLRTEIVNETINSGEEVHNTTDSSSEPVHVESELFEAFVEDPMIVEVPIEPNFKRNQPFHKTLSEFLGDADYDAPFVHTGKLPWNNYGERPEAHSYAPSSDKVSQGNKAPKRKNVCESNPSPKSGRKSARVIADTSTESHPVSPLPSSSPDDDMDRQTTVTSPLPATSDTTSQSSLPLLEQQHGELSRHFDSLKIPSKRPTILRKKSSTRPSKRPITGTSPKGIPILPRPPAVSPRRLFPRSETEFGQQSTDKAGVVTSPYLTNTPGTPSLSINSHLSPASSSSSSSSSATVVQAKSLEAIILPSTPEDMRRNYSGLRYPSQVKHNGSD